MPPACCPRVSRNRLPNTDTSNLFSLALAESTVRPVAFGGGTFLCGVCPIVCPAPRGFTRARYLRRGCYPFQKQTLGKSHFAPRQRPQNRGLCLFLFGKTCYNKKYGAFWAFLRSLRAGGCRLPCAVGFAVLQNFRALYKPYTAQFLAFPAFPARNHQKNDL